MLLPFMNVLLLVHPSLEDYGFISTLFVYPFSFLLYHISVFFNYEVGLAIILITVLVRLLILPLVIKQQRTLEVYEIWKKERETILEKYKSNYAENAKDRIRETTALSKKYNFKPFRLGCLPLVIQLIILISLIQAVSREIQFSSQSFLWFVLGKQDPVFVLNIILALLVFFYMRQTSRKYIKLRYFFTTLITILSFFLASAITLYLITTYILLLLQHYLLKSYFKKDKQKHGRLGLED